jgi:NAD(P)-dependent dehydrogenase (short-subunit alcohol dehydrogenase family)
LKGSVIIIGAGPGLGSSLARKFAKEGHHVFAVRRERHTQELNSLCDEIKDSGGLATAMPADARDEEQVKNLFSEISKSGSIDCLVFNIGANVFFPIEETTSRVFRKVWEMATFAGFLAGREAAKHMKDKGTIIFTGATASKRGGSGFAAFSSAKFGLRALAQSLARELGPKGIHVAHTIIDGAIDHPWIKENFPDTYKLKEVDGILNPDHIAEAYYNLHLQEKTAWTHELDLRPYMEKF